MKTLIRAAIRCSLMFTAVTASLFSVRPAQAFTVRLKEVGANVVANGSGAFNLTGLTLFGIGGGDAHIEPNIAAIDLADAPGASQDTYFGFSGPSSFGTGLFTFASSSSGDLVSIVGAFNELFVPRGYVSGTALSGSSTYNSATFASLGVTPGTYVWTWGTGLPNQNFTLRIGVVPDGGSTVSLLGFALLGLAAVRRKLSY